MNQIKKVESCTEDKVFVFELFTHVNNINVTARVRATSIEEAWKKFEQLYGSDLSVKEVEILES